MTIGDRIKSRRIELNMSIDELASKLNKNRATVYRYESNDIENFPTSVLEPLAKALNTSPAHLMGWITEDSSTQRKPMRSVARLENNEFTSDEDKQIDAFIEFLLKQRAENNDK